MAQAPIPKRRDTAKGAPTAPRARKPKAPPPPRRADMRLTAWTAAAIIAADQALKYWVVHVMGLDRLREIDVLPPWLNLRMAWNQGVNFGLMASDRDLTRWLLIGVAIAICLWVWIWIWRSAAGGLARFAAGLLIGGAIGNVIDRLYYGAVADFLNMSLPGWQNPYSFNVADISIFAGAIGLVLMPQPKAPPAAAGKVRSGTAPAAPAKPKPAPASTATPPQAAAPAPSPLAPPPRDSVPTAPAPLDNTRDGDEKSR